MGPGSVDWGMLGNVTGEKTEAACCLDETSGESVEQVINLSQRLQQTNLQCNLQSLASRGIFLSFFLTSCLAAANRGPFTPKLEGEEKKILSCQEILSSFELVRAEHKMFLLSFQRNRSRHFTSPTGWRIYYFPSISTVRRIKCINSSRIPAAEGDITVVVRVASIRNRKTTVRQKTKIVCRWDWTFNKTYWL